MGRTVLSQAGEPVQVYSTEEWEQLTGQPLKAVFRSTCAIALALWHHGTIREPSGRATGLLHPLAVEMGYQGSALGLTSAMNSPNNKPAFARQMKQTSKRTFAISLVALPDRWLEVMQEMEPESFAEPEPSEGDRDAAEVVAQLVMPAATVEPEPEPDGLELDIELPEYVPPPEPSLEPSPLLEVSASVAMALLTQVVEIISAGSPEAMDARVKHLTQEVSDIADKLARRLQENDALRRKVRELGDEINSVKYERDGLRTRLRLTEHNLQRALKSDVMQQVNERVMRELEKVMRVVPSPSRKDAD